MDWGSLAAASADQVNGIINYFSNEHANETNLQLARETNEMNLKIARENNEFQERMTGINNAFSHDEALLSREFNAQEAEKQRAWESAEQQVARLRAAGLNPALAFSNGGTASAATSTPASPHGSGVSPSVPNLVTPHYEAFQFKDPSESVKAFAEALQALGQAKKLGVETDTLEKEQQDLLRMVHAKGDMADLENELAHRFAEKERSAQFQQMTLNLGKETQSLLNLIREGAKIDAETELTRIKQQTEKETSGLKAAERAIAEKENENYFKLFEAKVNNILSSTELNLASAQNQRELAISEDRLREVRKNLFSSQQKEAESAAQELAEIARNYAIRNGMLPNEMNWLEIQRMYLQQIREDLKSKEFENTWTGRLLHSLAGPAAAGSAAAAIKAGAAP